MNNEENDYDPFTASGEFAAYVNNELSSDNDNVYSITGLVPNEDSETLEFASFIEQMYDPSQSPDMPQYFENTYIGDMLRKKFATKRGNKAIQEGNTAVMKRIVGKQEYGYDASSIHALRKLRDRMKQDAYIGYLFGHMGDGKTEFANLCGELAKEELDYTVISNVRSLHENEHTDAYVYTFGELLKEITNGLEIENLQDLQKMKNNPDKEIETLDDDILFIFDEGNQEASGYSNDAYETMDKMGNLITLLRKVGGNLIIIGHTGKDVHPHIRRLTNDCIKKVSKKKCEFYEAVNEKGEGIDSKEEINGIPKSNWTFDTLEISFWDWTLATQNEIDNVTNEMLKNNTKERNMSIFQDYHTGDENHSAEEMTQQVIADKYELTKGRVSQILKEMKNKVNEYQNAQSTSA